MEFIFKSYKLNEFDSTLKNFFHVNDINTTGLVVEYNHEGDTTTAVVRDSLTKQLTDAQIDELNSIK